MNYSLLLTRSVDFDEFARVLYPSYPDELERPLVLSLIQIALGPRRAERLRVAHDRRPAARTRRAHKVLQLLSFGDHQVANVATEVEARTIGSHIRPPALDPGRHTDASLLRDPADRPLPVQTGDARSWCGTSVRCGRPAAARRRTRASARPPPPITNTPPRIGVDPHDLVIDSEARIRRADRASSCGSTAS